MSITGRRCAKLKSPLVPDGEAEIVKGDIVVVPVPVAVVGEELVGVAD